MLDYTSIIPKSVLSILKTDGNFIEKLPSLVVRSEEIYNTKSSIETLYSALLQLYTEKCQVFDNAPDINIFDVKYAVKQTVSETDCKVLLYAVSLLDNLSEERYTVIIKRAIINILGRFTLLFIDNPDLNCQTGTNLSSLFREIAIRTINYILSVEWSFEDTVLVRITVLNLFIVMGIKSEPEYNDIIKRLYFNHNQDSIGNTTFVVEECLEWYVKSFICGKLSPEPIQFQWLYSYVYKKRFGILYCKKFQRTSIQPYAYIATVLSPCFNNASPRNAGLLKSALCVKNGEVIRSSEYHPTESSFLYNFSTMKFE